MQWIEIQPIAAVVTRDGRRFDAGESTAIDTIFPRPSTVAGAVAAAIGGAFNNLVGPFVVRRLEDSYTLLLPSPLDLCRDDRRELRILEPTKVSASSNDYGLEALVLGDGEPMKGWLDAKWIAAYLSGDVDRRAAHNLEPTDPYVVEPRVGLMREGRQAAEGFLYRADNLVLHDEYALAALVEFTSDEQLDSPQVVRFGGEARLATISNSDAPFDLESLRPKSFPGGRVRVLLATPGVFPGGAAFPVPSNAKVITSVSKGPEPIATFGHTTIGKYAQPGVRQLRYGVAPGSVYYLEFESETAANVWAEGAHGKALRFSKNTEFDRLSTAGFNVVLAGTWKYNNSEESQ